MDQDQLLSGVNKRVSQVFCSHLLSVPNSIHIFSIYTEESLNVLLTGLFAAQPSSDPDPLLLLPLTSPILLD